MRQLFKARNIIFIIVVIAWLVFFLWQGYKWQKAHYEYCRQHDIEAIGRILD